MKEPQIFILLLLVSFAAVAAVLFTPALPLITKEFNLTKDLAQWTMTIFLIGYAFGNLPYGPLSNRFGRKKTLYLGICLAILGEMVVIMAAPFHSFGIFLFGRLLSALGSTVGIKIAYTIIGDVYKHEQATKKISYFLGAFAFGPAIAMAIGGFLTTNFGWVSCFYFLIAYSLILLFLSSLLPETSQGHDLGALNLQKIGHAFALKFRNKKIILCSIILGFTAAFIYVFSSESPFIGIDQMGLSPERFGYLNLIPSLGMVVGAFFSNNLAGKVDTSKTLSIGISVALGGSVAMLLLFLFNVLNWWTLFAPVALVYGGLSLLVSNTASIALSHAKDKSTASAVMNFINLGVCVIAVFLISAIPSDAAFILPLFFLGLGICLVLLKLQLFKLSDSVQ